MSNTKVVALAVGVGLLVFIALMLFAGRDMGKQPPPVKLSDVEEVEAATRPMPATQPVVVKSELPAAPAITNEIRAALSESRPEVGMTLAQWTGASSSTRSRGETFTYRKVSGGRGVEVYELICSGASEFGGLWTIRYHATVKNGVIQTWRKW